MNAARISVRDTRMGLPGKQPPPQLKRLKEGLLKKEWTVRR